MAFTGSICDVEGARRAAGTILTGQNVLGVAASSLSSVATAQAAALTAQNTKSVCDWVFARSCQRAYTLASNYGASFSSSYTTLYGGLPDSAGHQRNIFCGG